ncbi:MAG: response regulator [Actinomycetota bacterium]|nr:response regulator [Actinomycetota bacterium]
MDEAALKQARILIVDDERANVTLLERVLETANFVNVTGTTESSKVLELCEREKPDLLLLDLQMPSPNGFEVMELLKPSGNGPVRLPILMLTADKSRETKRRALELGASDFLNKPFDMAEVVLRIQNLLLTRLLQQELLEHNEALEEKVRDRTRDLEEARLEVIDRLALAAEYRDDTAGEHTQRVGRLSGRLARELGMPEDKIELICRAAPLHDVGNLGISDAILLKQGDLTEDEFEVVKLHVSIGSEILGRSRTRLLQLAEEIARTHHERWDGAGYPAGLKGDEIPLAGRIVAVADAFDSMTNRPAHRDSLAPAAALAEIRGESGLQFDPLVVEALTGLGREALDGSAELSLVA